VASHCGFKVRNCDQGAEIARPAALGLQMLTTGQLQKERRVNVIITMAARRSERSRACLCVACSMHVGKKDLSMTYQRK